MQQQRLVTVRELKGDLNMFFEQGLYNPTTIAEGCTWLAQFQGMMSISSNQYFGHDEEETLSGIRWQPVR
jgi:hypothetical protein